MNWYILQESGALGPIENEEMDLRLKRGELPAGAMVGNSAEGPWGPASSVFPLAFGVISVTAVPPVIPTDHARRVMASTQAPNVKSAPIPLGVSPSASTAGEIGPARS